MNFTEMTKALRFLAIDMIEQANSGHPGIALGFADVMTVLFRDFFKFDPKNPENPNRDRLVFSAGHGSALLYALMYLTGYEDISLNDIKSFRKKGSKCSGHPEYGLLKGVEVTTGPLGQGLANSVGMAIAQQKMNAAQIDTSHENFIYVVVGDGDLMEGISHEASSLAGTLKLAKLIVLYDDNNVTIDGSADITCQDDVEARFSAYNWHYQKVDGHDEKNIANAIKNAQADPRPSIISCKTIIGKFSPSKAGTCNCHGAPLGQEEVLKMREILGWNFEPFFVPEEVLSCWRNINNEPVGKTCADNFKKIDKQEIENIFSTLKKDITSQQASKMATRKSSNLVLNKLVEAKLPLIGGSADLSPSNGTFAKNMSPICADKYNGNYIHYGIREHAMGGIMNGINLYQPNIIPYGGTFLCFCDYMKPSIRMSAMMNLGVIYIFTHDSIGVGEDGPTHQPVEQIPNLRMIPNLHVIRPSDALETAECWQIALLERNVPTALILSRQDLPIINKYRDDNLCMKGAYVIGDGDNNDRNLTIISTGSEVSLAIEVKNLFKEKNINVSVVSMPCCEIFDRQDESYRKKILGTSPIFSVEASATPFWAKYTGNIDHCFGIDDFGISAPYKDVFEHFELTPIDVYKKICLCMGYDFAM